MVASIMLSSVTEDCNAATIHNKQVSKNLNKLTEEDDTEAEITNDHLDGHEMDAGDILAYSGEISGELSEQ